MSATSRELVHQALDFERPSRAPRDLWLLPWAEMHHAEELKAIRRDFPPDFADASGHFREQPRTTGNPHRIGIYVDEWGCAFDNVQDGVIGQVKDPLIKDWAADVAKVHFPREWLTLDRDAVNRDCAATDKFVLAEECPRP